MAHNPDRKTLQDIFEEQKKFESLFVDFERLEQDFEYLDQLMQQFAHYINREVYELLDEFNWKPHADRKRHNADKIVGEVVDVFTFVINLCLIVGISPDELIEGYFLKNKLNWERQVARGRVDESQVP